MKFKVELTVECADHAILYYVAKRAGWIDPGETDADIVAHELQMHLENSEELIIDDVTIHSCTEVE